MRIVVDARCLMEGRRTGVEEYTLGILENLLELDKENDYVLFFNSWKRPRFDFSVFLKYPNVKIKHSRFPNKLLNFSFWYFGWPKIDRLAGGADAVFMPNITFAAVSKGVRLVLVVHDLSFERYPEHFSLVRRLWHIFVNPKKLCRRAAKIIAVSRSTGRDLESVYGIRKNKVAVIPSAVNRIFQVIDRNDRQLVEIKERYDLPYRFILHLATIEPRKNALAAARAFDALMREAHEKGDENLWKYKLVIAGSPGWMSRQIFSQINWLEFRDHIQIIRYVAEADKVFLYNLASVFIYSSFFEGFGFPPLEAMRSGVPVICSNNSSMPEVVGDAAIMIDPDRPDELYRALKEVLTDQKLRERLVKKGLERAKEFDWKKTAIKTLEVLTEK